MPGGADTGLGQITPGEITGAVAIWQGFEHHWTYNHRLNRFGDYVYTVSRTDNLNEAFVTHTGATGLGRDTGTSVTNYSLLSSDRPPDRTAADRIPDEGHSW
ncbi:MAG TPA: hypothetical protein VKA68_18260 [bacterium]|nr:hypothetical protein [bacterium]